MRALFMLALVPLTACSVSSGATVKGEGSGSTRSFAVADFTGVVLKGSDDVEIRTGGGFSVRAEGPSDVLDRLQIERDGDTLKIGRSPDSSFSWGTHRGAKIFVTLPKLQSASVTGSGDMTVDKAEADDFDASTAGSGSIRIDQLQAQKASLSIAGSGDIAASGAAQKLSLSIARSGDIDAAGLSAREASASIAGSGSIRANVKGPANVSIMGSGDADMGSDAQCSISKVGSGTVRCGGK